MSGNKLFINDYLHKAGYGVLIHDEKTLAAVEVSKLDSDTYDTLYIDDANR